MAPPIASDNQLCAFSHGRESIQRRLAQRCESSPQKKAHWGKEAETQLRLDDTLERKLGETSTFHQGVWRPVCFNASSSSKTNDFRTINSAPPKTSWVFHMFCNMASTSIGIIMVLASMTIVISMLCVLDFSFSNMYVKTYYGFRAENSIDCFRPNFQERTLTLWAMHALVHWMGDGASLSERKNLLDRRVALVWHDFTLPLLEGYDEETISNHSHQRRNEDRSLLCSKRNHMFMLRLCSHTGMCRSQLGGWLGTFSCKTRNTVPNPLWELPGPP